MALRVVQWATGSVGVAAIKGVLEHPELELVGCWVHSKAKAGRDVGEIIGTDPLGRDRHRQHRRHPRAGRRRGDLRAAAAQRRRGDARCCARARTSSARSAGSIPSESEAAPLEAAAREGGVTLHGAGIGPGAATELFPLLLSVMSTGVTFVRAEEFSDLRTYGAPDVLRHVMGFGGTPEKRAERPDAEAAQRRVLPVGAADRRPARLRRRPEDPHLARRSPSPPRRSTRRWG